MKFFKLVLVILLTTVVLSLADGPPPAVSETESQEREVGPLDGEEVWIRILLFGTEESGANKQGASAGGGGLLYTAVGSVDEEGRPTGALCSRGTGSTRRERDLEELRGEAAHLWTVEARVLEARTEHVRFELDWARYDATHGGRSEKARGDHRVIMLREGETHVLDFIDRDPGGGPGHCPRNITIEIEAGVTEDPQFADTQIDYDLWLVDESPDGTRRTRHVETLKAQGERFDAVFDLMRWSIPDARFPDGTTAEVAGEVRLSARGRLRRDRTVDMTVGATRWVGVVPAGGKRRGGVGAGGERSVNLNPGEPLEIVLPTPGGSHAEWVRGRDSGSAVVFESDGGPGRSDGVTAEEGRLRVDFKRFFAGHKMSLIVTVRPESQG